jgi:hypothetical protein
MDRIGGSMECGAGGVEYAAGYIADLLLLQENPRRRNFWHNVEDYISERTTSLFSHGICPSCMALHVESQLEPSSRE